MAEPTELCYTPIEALAPRLRGREVSPVEVVEAVLDRIDALEPRLNAFITVMAEAAVAEARRAEAEIAAGRHRGPLHGVPVTVKDLYDTAGVRTSGGARITARRVPERDCTVVQRLRAAGAIIVGKCNMFEFAFGHVHPDFGPSRNPWALDRTTSGSSSGSGAAVAAGLGQASMGSDTGGSIRGPAAYCGIVGLKPTYGRVSRAGVMPLSWSLDHCGPMTRTVWDCAVVLQAVAGHDPADPGSAERPVPDLLAQIDAGAADLRLGVPRNHLIDLPEPITAAQAAAEATFRELGARVVDVELPDARAFVLANTTILSAEAAAIHETWYRERPEDYSPAVRQRLEAGFTLLATDLVRAQRARRTLIEQTRAAMADLDLLLLPASAVMPATIEESLRTMPMGPDWERVLDRGRFTSPYNLTGLPAIAFPGGFSADGLPVGLQLVGHPWQEVTVLRAARAFERVRPWADRRPPL